MAISDVKSGERLAGVFLLQKYEVRESKNGKKYADIIISDKSGSLSSKLWDVSGAEKQQLSAGAFVQIRGVSEIYNGNLQLVIEEILKIQPNAAQIEELVESAPFAAEKMYNKIIEILSTEIADLQIKEITLSIFESNKEKLMYYPAAKSFHHAVRAGLLYHVFTMLRSAKQLLEIYTFLNKDLVYSGVVLHDIGKITEMESEEIGIIKAYTTEGLLLGHIVSGICEIDTWARKLSIDPEKALILKHILLSHHMTPEFGSPKPPMIPEAEMVHYLDELDSRMNQMEKTSAGLKKGTFAERVWILDNRTIYKPNFGKE